ncbi:RNA-directed DNA polymerase, eukaryota, reverse transcriptase zinc-binding domain protein [Tanacetum coccineum]|uniref:RNA-directed DNA polymerase, eukaryota, reverse transcriptase zinc-binding domain protein n=1 Tax=Tanacetum coccineum TaxID=301880 RepID=A0ABQ5D2W2_9ASTR
MYDVELDGVNTNESGNNKGSGNEELEESDKDGDNGVFGIGTNGMEYGDSDADTKENCEMSQSKGTNACIPDNIADNLHKTNSNNESSKMSYANRLADGMKPYNNDLFFIPTTMKDNGEKVVVFDEELVKEGSEKWKYTNEEGMKYIIDQSPWLVNGKPLLVQKWDPESVIVKESPCKIPIWIRLLNIPLEAWNVKGISALASRLGRPIKIDQIMSGDMCRVGSRRLGYARVLVEINAEDDFFDKIEINYVDDMKKVKSTKWVKVEYTWKPSRCSQCKVFGHSLQSCEKRPKPIVDTNIKANDSNKNEGANKEGFMETVKPMTNNQKRNEQVEGSVDLNTSPKIWKVGQDTLKEFRKCANKYAYLCDDENNEVDPFINKRLIVDEFFKKKSSLLGNDSSYEEDVFENDNPAAKSFVADEILRNDDGGERDQDNYACEYSIGRWNWISNVAHSPTSCRIVVGWNSDVVDVMVVQKSLDSYGDFNVTLKAEEHSNGTSNMTIDMNEFKDTINNLEKLDSIMVNDEFLNQFVNANGVFLPYLVSDHSPAIMIIPKGIVKKKKSFRFANYVVEKEDFLDLVKEGWKKDIRGYQIVIGLKEKLKEAQKEVDSDATNLDKRKIVVLLVNEYSKAAEDKLKLLCQKAKIKWLKEGDRNSSFFHSVIKARKHISRIDQFTVKMEEEWKGT